MEIIDRSSACSGRGSEEMQKKEEEEAPVRRRVKHEIRGVKLFEDGTVDRSLYQASHLAASATPFTATAGAFSKDVCIDTATGVWCRIFLPEAAVVALRSSGGSDGDTAAERRLPIILYFHGGGFVFNSAASEFYHDYGCKLAAKIHAIVVSVEYRLAPEHRLPAAFDDGAAALQWLHAQSSGGDPWLLSHADFSKCILMGHSAGATIAYHVALREALSAGDSNGNGERLSTVQGILLAIPFFGGEERTSSEMKYGESDDLVTMQGSDAAWAMALPLEAAGERTHPFCCVYPLEDPDHLRRLRWAPSLVVAGSTDPLRDRQIELAEHVQSAGHEVWVKEYGCYGHRLLFPEVKNEEDVEEAYSIMQHFLSKCFALH